MQDAATDRLQMTRNAFYEAHIHAAIAQASVK